MESISDCIQQRLSLSLKKTKCKSIGDSLNSSVKKTLLSGSKIEFVPGKKQSSFQLNELKSKYTVLKPSVDSSSNKQLEKTTSPGIFHAWCLPLLIYYLECF